MSPSKTIHLVGDFNGWSETDTEMTKNAKGEYRMVLDLEPDSEFEYRYLINGEAGTTIGPQTNTIPTTKAATTA